ncbi:MAG: two-component regulator propeller domain-containing protein [Saprospiraceae bacterium]|nr:two-component regulator propeller domain-containing protein [Saprospiraceae bacterium]
MKTILYPMLLFCWLGTPAIAQLRMETIGVTEGLSQGFITSLIQDSRGFIWVGTFDGLNRYDGYTVRRFMTNPFDPWSLPTSYITDLYEDERQLIWVGTHHGLVVFDPVSERFFNLSQPQFGLPANHVKTICCDKQGQIFVHIPSESDPALLFRIQTPSDLAIRLRLQKFPLEGLQAIPLDNNVKIGSPALFLGCIGDTMPLVVGDDGKALRYVPGQKKLAPLDLNALPREKTDAGDILWNKHFGYYFRWEMPNGRDTIPPPSFWAKTFHYQQNEIGFWLWARGPFLIKKNRSRLHFDGSFDKKNLLTSASFYQQFNLLLEENGRWNNQICVDRTGLLWVGTGGVGLRKINPRQLSFGNFLEGASISSIRELPDGRLWVRQYSDQTFIINPQNGAIETPPWKERSFLFECMADSKNNYWLLEPYSNQFKNQRLVVFTPGTGQSIRLSEQIPFEDAVPEKLFEDRDGNIWLAAHSGQLFRFRPGQFSSTIFYYATHIRSNLRATAIAQDKSGTIWVGTNRGLLKVENANNNQPRFSLLQHDPANRQSLSINWVTSLCLDPNDANILWLGTRGGGLNRLDLYKQTFSFLIESPNGLPDNVVYGVLADQQGNLWCSTNRGVCRYNPAQSTFVTYREPDGLLSTEFNTNAYLRTRDGRLWFGGVNGLNVLRPENITTNPSPPQIAISGIKILGVPQTLDAYGALILPFEKNNILIEFVALDFASPSTNRFRHRLKGLDYNWVNDGNQHSANYAALQPGHYIFEVQGATADGPWSESVATLHITIRPPWYRSWMAWIAYVLAFGAGVLSIIRYRLLQHQAQANQLESERLKQFETVKNQFFANVAHELRTPLTVILGLAGRLKKEEEKENLGIVAQKIETQGKTLLELTDQILDLAKLEGQQFSLHFFNGNISDFVSRHTESLTPLAESKGLHLTAQNMTPVVWMDFDPSQLQKILNNLIANAIRHSTPGGKIRVQTALSDDRQWLKLSVEDEGEGIDGSDLPHIFERFYQGHQPAHKTGASGLGLTLTRDLVRAMGGEVVVNSTPGKGATFTITLPVRNTAPRMADPGYTKVELAPVDAPSPVHDTSHLPLLLVLEDNDAVADFLRLCLKNAYRLIFADDGAAGLRKAFEHIPDLILTDVAMPGMDGFDVVGALKSDPRTSHIPVVMLTAKVEHTDRIEGKRRGANAYLTKPFEEQELLLVLKNLLHLQQQWKERYATFDTSAPTNDDAVQVEDAFMQRLFAVFETHYADETFQLDRLCRSMGMSSSQLDRKLKALSDQSPMYLLRRFRLQKARKMLQELPRPSIKDVCFRTGFKSPSHFSRAFSEEFGIPPSEA